jgi:F0F1-type ATP synthase assembly protein I
MAAWRISGSSLSLKSLLNPSSSGEAIMTLSVVVAALIVGELLDSVRDLLEWVWDHVFAPMPWSLFDTADKDKIEQFYNSRFTWYAFDCNISLALVLVILLALYFGTVPVWFVITLVLSLGIFVVNACSLRSEMVRLTAAAPANKPQLP